LPRWLFWFSYWTSPMACMANGRWLLDFQQSGPGKQETLAWQNSQINLTNGGLLSTLVSGMVLKNSDFQKHFLFELFLVCKDWPVLQASSYANLSCVGMHQKAMDWDTDLMHLAAL
jgi:hypothetical protein